MACLCRPDRAVVHPFDPTPDDVSGPSHTILPQPDRITVVNRYPPFEVLRATLLVIGAALGVYLLWRIQEVVFLLFLAILLATAIEPIVFRLRRGPFTRGTGVLIVYTVIVLAIGVPIAVFAPRLIEQTAAFTEALPERLQTLRGYVWDAPRPVAEAANETLDRAAETLAQPARPTDEDLVETGTAALHTIVSLLTVFVLAFYWMVERPTIKRAVLRAATPRWAREVNTVWQEIEDKLGGWVRGQLILMGSMGLMAGVGYFFLGLPNAVLLGVAAGLLEVVPLLGPFIAFVPAVLVALAIDPTKAIAVIVYAVIIQQFESQVLVPRVMGHTVGVSPLAVLLGILVGAAIAGIPGAFVAVPVAGALQVVLAHVFNVEDPVQAEAHPPGTDRSDAQRGYEGRADEARPRAA